MVKQKAVSSVGARETRACHHYKKVGHLKKDCYSWKRKMSMQGFNSGSSSGSAEFVTKCDDSEVLNVVEVELEQFWILDSGCSFHMCPYKEWFSELKEVNTGSVFLGNNRVCKIQGIGQIKLRLLDGSVDVLTKVRYIPELKRNLISLGTLDSK